MKESRQYLTNPDDSLEGYKFIEKYVKVKGTQFRLTDIIPFSKKDDVWLECEHEPNNKYDKNAIKLFGCSKGFFSISKYFLGYVPKEISEELIVKGLLDHTLPRLRRIWVPEEETEATIVFQIFIEDGYQDQYKSKYDSNH
jgi:hypothetical protein